MGVMPHGAGLTNNLFLCPGAVSLQALGRGMTNDTSCSACGHPSAATNASVWDCNHSEYNPREFIYSIWFFDTMARAVGAISLSDELPPRPFTANALASTEEQWRRQFPTRCNPSD